MQTYVVTLKDEYNTKVTVKATDMEIVHPGSLTFWTADIVNHKDSTYDHPTCAYFPAGTYTYISLDGYTDEARP